uniref:ATP-dependent Clp protease adapter protein ClpS n=1 Tax=Desulfatirhabdium butyrativorans TaxID=340467 RepID=A0A7C4MKZ8_9BACT
MTLPGTHFEEEVTSEQEEQLTEPPLYKVILLNDDYTTMEFVVDILMSVFQKTIEEATTIMLAVHRKGSGVAGVYPYEIAETKVDTVHTLARENGFPLRCTMEPE